jgi:hypothetical protein
MTDAARAAIARQQRELLTSLRGGIAPKEFDAQQIRRCSRSLIRKRAREAAEAWPAHAAWLGPRFGPLFETFASMHAPCAEGGPLADGYQFIEHASGKFASARRDVRFEWFMVQLRWYRTTEGLRPRTGLSVRIAQMGWRPVVAFRYVGRGVAREWVL